MAFGAGTHIGGDVRIGSQTIYVDSASGGRAEAIPHQAPLLPAHHVERTHLLQSLHLELLREAPALGALRILALHGLGGAGKSTLAAELAHSEKVLQSFPDGVLWASLGPQPQIGTLLTSWVIGVGERPTEVWSEASATSFLRTALRDRRILIVIDDAWSEEHVRPFLVGGRSCHVVLTTRRASVVDQLGAVMVAVDELEPEESIRLMAKRSGRSTPLAAEDEGEARALAQQLGHLPLALELVAALVARRYDWREAKRQLITYENALPPDKAELTPARRKLEACLGLSLAALRAESASLWQAFAWLCLIPYGQQICPALAAKLWEVDPAQAQRWLHAMEDDALLRRGSDGYTLHNLLQQMAERIFCSRAPEGLGKTLAQGHQELVRRYRAASPSQQWADVVDDGYIIDRWAWHLVQAGDGDAVFDLLSVSEPDGTNRWYQRRSKTGRLAGYLDDLRIARQVSVEMCSRWRQVFVALCQSSVLSMTVNYTDDVVFALVRKGIWSPLWALRWAQDVCAAHRKVDCLLAVSAAAQIASGFGATSNSGFADVARQALLLAQSLVAARPPTEAAVQVMVRAVATAAVPDSAAALAAAFAWCKSAELKARLLRQLPDSVPLAAFQQQLNAARDAVDRTLLIASLVRRCPATERAAFGRQFVKELARGLQAAMATSQEKVEQVPVVLLFEKVEPKHLVASPGVGDTVDVLCDAAGLALPLLDNGLQEQATLVLSRYHAHVPVRKLLETLARFRHLQRVETDHRDAANFHLLNGSEQRKVAADQLLLRGDDTLLLAIVEADREGRDADELMVWMGTLSVTLSPSLLQGVAAKLTQRNPQALCPRLILSPATVSVPDLIRRIDRADASKAALLVTACLLYAPYPIATDVLAAFSKVQDRKEQARALLAILPFLPSGANHHHFVDLQDSRLAGPQIAGMTSMMVELSKAIDADALTEVVEATSKNESEWWVVEALSVTLLRVRKVSELNAIVEAAPRILNLDLRARLLERVAIRLADLRIDALAIEVAQSIELPALRWAALHELAVRFASTGNIARAVESATLIEPSASTQRAIAFIALELGALDMTDDARRLVNGHIFDTEWKTLVAPVFADGEANRQLAADREYSRASGEQRLSRFDMILSTLEGVEAVVGAESALGPVIAAARQRSNQLLEAAVIDLWKYPEGDQELLCDTLSRLPRAQTLIALAQMSPTLDICAEAGDVVRIVEAIHHVSRWWQ